MSSYCCVKASSSAQVTVCIFGSLLLTNHSVACFFVNILLCQFRASVWRPGASGAVHQYIGPLAGGNLPAAEHEPAFLQIHFMGEEGTRLHRRRQVSGLDQLANAATINEVLEVVEEVIRTANPDYHVFQQAHTRFHGVAELERQVIVVDEEGRQRDQPQHDVNVSGEVAAVCLPYQHQRYAQQPV